MSVTIQIGNKVFTDQTTGFLGLEVENALLPNIGSARVQIANPSVTALSVGDDAFISINGVQVFNGFLNNLSYTWAGEKIFTLNLVSNEANLYKLNTVNKEYSGSLNDLISSIIEDTCSNNGVYLTYSIDSSNITLEQYNPAGKLLGKTLEELCMFDNYRVNVIGSQINVKKFPPSASFSFSDSDFLYGTELGKLGFGQGRYTKVIVRGPTREKGVSLVYPSGGVSFSGTNLVHQIIDARNYSILSGVKVWSFSTPSETISSISLGIGRPLYNMMNIASISTSNLTLVSGSIENLKDNNLDTYAAFSAGSGGGVLDVYFGSPSDPQSFKINSIFFVRQPTDEIYTTTVTFWSSEPGNYGFLYEGNYIRFYGPFYMSGLSIRVPENRTLSLKEIICFAEGYSSVGIVGVDTDYSILIPRYSTTKRFEISNIRLPLPYDYVALTFSADPSVPFALQYAATSPFKGIMTSYYYGPLQTSVSISVQLTLDTDVYYVSSVASNLSSLFPIEIRSDSIKTMEQARAIASAILANQNFETGKIVIQGNPNISTLSKVSVQSTTFGIDGLYNVWKVQHLYGFGKPFTTTVYIGGEYLNLNELLYKLVGDVKAGQVI